MSTVVHPLSYRCPHCGTSMGVEPSTADEMLICPSPHCGKPFKAGVPVAAPAAPLVVRPGEAPPQPVAKKATEAPAAEQELVQVHLTMLRRYPIRLGAYMLAAALGIAAVIYAWTSGWPMIAVLAAFCTAFPLYRLVAWGLRMRRTKVTLTNKRCVLTTGVFRQQTTEILLENVSDVQVQQSFVGRLLRAGDVVIVSDTEDRRQLMLMGVADPELVATRIRELL